MHFSFDVLFMNSFRKLIRNPQTEVIQWFESGKECSGIVVKLSTVLKDRIPYNQPILKFGFIREIMESEWSTLDTRFSDGSLDVNVFTISKVTAKSDCNCLSVNESICTRYPTVVFPAKDLLHQPKKRCPFLKFTVEEMKVLNSKGLETAPIVNSSGYEMCLGDYIALQSSNLGVAADIVLLCGSLCLVLYAMCCL